jgi:hypothetical protein
MRKVMTRLIEPRFIGLATLSFLLVLSIRYYLERTACFDSAWFSWLLIDSGTPHSFLARYGSWLSQLFPVALVHAGASLEAVLRAYSISQMAIHVVLFLLIAFRLRDERGTIALPLTLVTGLHLLFYYGASELNQGLSWTVLVWVLFRRTLDRWDMPKRWSLLLVLMLTNIWTSFHHQVLLLPLVYFVGLEIIERNAWKDRRAWAIGGVLVLWYVARIKLFATSSYEQERMPGLSDVIGLLPKLGDLPSAVYLEQNVTKFKPFLLLAVLTISCLGYTRRWLLLLWTLAWSTGFMVLVLITDRAQGSPIMYENFYPVLALCWCMAFAQVLVEERPRSVTAIRWAVPVIAAIGCLQIYRAHHILTAKVHYAQRLTDELRAKGIHKAIGTSECLPWPIVYSYWPMAFETALVSGIKGPREAVTFYCDEPIDRFDTLMHEPNAFLGPAWNPVWFGSQNLRQNFFALPAEGYTLVTSVLADSMANVLGPSQLSLVPTDRVVWLPPAPVANVDVSLTNHTDRMLGCLLSNGRQLELRVEYYDEAGRGVYECKDITHIEQDIPAGTTMRQGLVLGRPYNAGRYRVEVELFAGDRPTGVHTTLWAIARPMGF